MKNTTLLILLTLFITSCGDKTREEILDRYDNGQKKVLVKYKGEGSDELIVKRISYYKNGQIDTEGNYKDGKRDGKLILYYENGQIRYEQNFKNGYKEGKYTHYYENGQIDTEGNYKDNLFDGKLTQYYENGQIKREENYKDGRFIK